MCKNILSIDTSFNQCSIAILHNQKIDNETTICYEKHEKIILPMLKKILIRNKMKINDFEVISFSNGPGNFTGIRIAASVAQGLSIPYNIPLIGISTFSILAQQAWRKKNIKQSIICIISGNKTIYYAKYKKNHLNIWLRKEIKLLSNINNMYKKIKILSKNWYFIGCGSIFLKIKKNFFLKSKNIMQPHAQDLIPLTIIEFKKRNFLSYNNMNLNYFYNPIYFIIHKLHMFYNILYVV
ncbi:tRNA threonylcarbamoyladenosine biosynthesis protein TsaB [Buchnera aphidicola (Phyllaphis fagi)]|uniref:tRNA (adenosine(37)-N6)-threonylcarbamoyltransferase complex dimerization subunit type 1 TsaB n=1 Tax=Buchnera aphidicola TaxID=9 RepID=UPI003464A103